MTRRGFLSGVVAIAAGTGVSVLGRTGDTKAIIKLHISGSAGRLGAALGIDEMSRTATILGTHLDAGSDHGTHLDLDAGSIVAEGDEYYVAADDRIKGVALDTWRRDHRDSAVGAVEWHASLEKYGAEQLNERFTRKTGEPMDAAAWIAWMLVRVVVDAELRGVALAAGRFDGHKGVALSFDAQRRMQQPMCIVDSTGGLLGVVG